MDSILFPHRESVLATAPALSQITLRDDREKMERACAPSAGIAPSGIWIRASTWGLLLLLLYFALDGVSPFVNAPTALRAVSTTSESGVLGERLGKVWMFVLCMIFVAQRHQAVRRLSMQMKLVTAFPILALLLFPVSQLATRTISSGALLLAAILLVYYIMSRYPFDELLELFLILGTGTIVASIVFALALPQYGLDRMGGHATAWKGIFSAKNYLGDMAVFFLTMAVAYRGRTSFLRFVRASQIVFCLVAIAFSQAATAYLLTAIYVAYLVIMRTLHRFRKKDYFVLCILLLGALSVAIVMMVATPDLLLSVLGKDSTLTGRTGIWSAAIDSISRRPLFGYGYQAFWLGLEGESYRVILAVSWLLAQAQNGFLDVTLEMGAAGLAVVLLVFGFAFRDAGVCLLRSRDHAQLRAVEWYLAVVLLTFICNFDESFLFEPKHLGSMIFVIACVGLKQEWLRLQASGCVPAPGAFRLNACTSIVAVPRLRKDRP
jgi:exopolysaccharide production protein ExoQ